MALEQFKTQVLLLHSQQSTLDALSAGFGDRYAVHVATSGAEALNTLGETPIHVIVSAQQLPGMSGLEALREARKRSPDTVGILLAAEDGDEDLEALVGDEEVFQVVRGEVTAESLLDLVESATRRIRMLAISESANDLAANVDEPVGEHIIMETSEHGTSIITDGTARLRALRAQQPPVAGHPGGRDVDVLVLTKDEDFLATILDSANGLHKVHHAHTAEQAESLVREHKVGVLVTDAAMAAAEMEEITQRLRKSSPRLVAIVAGRRDDGELLMDLINRGQVYRFLLKPVSPGRARLAIEASVKRHLEADDAAFKAKAKAPSPRKAPPARRPAAPAPAKAPEAKAPSKPAAPRPPAPQEAPDGEETLGVSGRFRKTVTGLTETLGGPGEPATERSGRGPVIAVGGAAALALAAGLAWWLMSAEPPAEPAETERAEARTEPEPSPSVVESDIPVMPARQPAAESAAAQPIPAYQPFLDEARAARDAGEIVTPPGNNALELFVAASEIAPGNDDIAAELTEVVELAISLAETALLERRTDDAARALDLVRLANPGHPRLPFLDAQVAERQLRARLERARLAIREQRFEDAAQALAAAAQVAGAEQAELGLLRDELATARGQQELDEVLARASERLDAGALTEPLNDNARYYYQLALSTEPDNAVARQGLSLVASRLILQARDALNAGALDDAERILADAAALDAASGELAAAADALAAARAAVEAERLAEEARRAEEERRAALEAERQAALEAEATGETAGETAAAPEDGAALATSGAPAASRATAGSALAPVEPEYVPISSLTRTNYVAPRYPRSAQRRNITGWADVSFKVDADGSVGEVEVLDSSPGDVFDSASVEAISQWRFEPPLENSVPVERRVAVRLSFDLE